jgi:hypothetical protein
MALFLDKFKKVHEADDHTILRHPDGHEIKVLHKSLSPKNMAQIKDLAMC